MSIRLWIHTGFKDPVIKLNEYQLHYIYKVMRKKNGDRLILFNQEEWIGELYNNTIQLISMIRVNENTRHKSIGIACVKKPRLEIAVEKITEIGINDIYLLNTDYTQKIHYDLNRLNRIAIEAAEQSNRLDVPKIYEPTRLSDFIDNFQGRLAMAHPYGTFPTDCSEYDGILIGPEGGWSDEELKLTESAQRIKLSNNILRTETASIIAALKLCKIG